MNRTALILGSVSALAMSMSTAMAQGEILPVTFDDFAGGATSPADEENSFSETVDDLTLTSAVADGGNFESNDNGAGIDSSVGMGTPKDGGGSFTRFQIDEFESYSLTFDFEGTLDLIVITALNTGGAAIGDGVGSIVVTNTNTSESVTVAQVDPGAPSAGGGAAEQTLTIDLSYSEGDEFVVTHTGDARYRVLSVTATPAPEPGSLLLAGAGVGMMLFRRRGADQAG